MAPFTHPLSRSISVSVDADRIDEHAKQLQPDPNVQCRDRGYSTFTYEAGRDLVQHSAASFITPGTVEGNSVNILVTEGKIPAVRDFGPLPPGFTETPVFKSICDQTLEGVAQIAGCHVLKAKLGAHLFKVRCGEVVGTPSPEGRHQDGFDYISVTVLCRDNVVGGESIMAESKDGPPLFQEEIQPGQGYVFDDRRLWHDVTPIEVAPRECAPYECVPTGHRVVLIITVNLLPDPAAPMPAPAEARKMVVVTRNDLSLGRTTNVIAHLSAGLATLVGPEEMNCVDYRDKDGAVYPSISWHNIVLLSGKKAGHGQLRTLLEGARAVGLPCVAFTESMEEGGAEAQLARTAALHTQDVVLDAVAVWGPPEGALKDLTKKFSLLK
jgi:hypothetical protein